MTEIDIIKYINEQIQICKNECQNCATLLMKDQTPESLRMVSTMYGLWSGKLLAYSELKDKIGEKMTELEELEKFLDERIIGADNVVETAKNRIRGDLPIDDIIQTAIEIRATEYERDAYLHCYEQLQKTCRRNEQRNNSNSSLKSFKKLCPIASCFQCTFRGDYEMLNDDIFAIYCMKSGKKHFVGERNPIPDDCPLGDA